MIALWLWLLAARKQVLLEEASRQLDQEGALAVCAVCAERQPAWKVDGARLVRAHVQRELGAFTDDMLRKLRVVGSDGWPQDLREFYDLHVQCPDSFQDQALRDRFTGVLLWRGGVVLPESDGNPTKLSVCSSCWTSLRNPRTLTPPKLAIANGFAIGRAPALFALKQDGIDTVDAEGCSAIEWQLVTRMLLFTAIRTVRAQTWSPSPQKALFGHVLGCELDTAAVAAGVLPRRPGDPHLAQLVLTGAFTAEDKLRALAPQRVRRERPAQLLQRLQACNPYYAPEHVNVDVAALGVLPECNSLPGHVLEGPVPRGVPCASELGGGMAGATEYN